MSVQSERDDLFAECRMAAKANKAMREVLGEAREYFDQRADADEPIGSLGPEANEEMELLIKIDKVLK